MGDKRLFDLGTYETDPGRAAIRALHREPEAAAIRQRDSGAGPVEALMHEYDLSSDEGLVLMMLAEALLRIPDAATRDLLIRDKLLSADFARHIGASPSVFVNLSTRALDITGRALRAAQEKKIWPRLAARMGEPMLRQSMLRAM